MPKDIQIRTTIRDAAVLMAVWVVDGRSFDFHYEPPDRYAFSRAGNFFAGIKPKRQRKRNGDT